MGNTLSNEGGKPPDDDIESNRRDFENPENLSHKQNHVYEAIQNGNLKELEKLKDMLYRLPFDEERGTPLMYAISCFKNKTTLDSLAIINKLLDLGCDVNEKSNGTYPLHDVCSIKYSTEEEEKQVLQLLEILSNTNKLEKKEIDDNNNSALHHAAYSGNNAAFYFLLKTKKKTDDSNVLEWVKSKNNENETALQIAAKHGHVKIMEVIYQNVSEHDGEELLDAIKYNENKEIESKLVERNDQKVGLRAKIIQKFTQGKEKEGYDEINLLENTASCVEVFKLVKSLNNQDLIFKPRDIKQNTTLHLAAERESSDVCQEIISDSGNIPAFYIGHKNKDEELAIDIAIRNGNTKMFKLLTERFVEFDQEDIFLKALKKFGIDQMNEVFDKLLFHYATKKGWPTFLMKLIKKYDDDSKNYMKKGDENGKTVAHLAAEIGNDELLKKLLKFSKDLRFEKDSEKKLPIHLAVENSHLGCIEILLDTKDYLKQLTAEDSDENSPFVYSNPRTFETLVEKLKKEGRAKDFFDSRKASTEKLMERAVVKDNAELVHLLLKNGFSISNGVVLFKAIEVQATKVIEIILDHPEGKKALMNARDDNGKPTTPFRELIKNCPNLALKVLQDIESSSKCKDEYKVECIEDSTSFVWNEKEKKYSKKNPDKNIMYK